MADSFTSLLRFVLQEDVGNINIWGDLYNQGVTDLVEQALTGRVTVDVTAGNVSLNSASGVLDQSRAMFIYAEGAPGVTREIIVPSTQKMYIVVNATTDLSDIEVRTVANTGVIIPATSIFFVNKSIMVFVDQADDQVRVITGAGATFPPQTDPWGSALTSIVNATAGDTAINWRWDPQGSLRWLRANRVSTTVANTQFLIRWDIDPQDSLLVPSHTGAPAVQLPDFWVENGTVIPCYLEISQTPLADWEFKKMDGSAWINGSLREHGAASVVTDLNYIFCDLID